MCLPVFFGRLSFSVPSFLHSGPEWGESFWVYEKGLAFKKLEHKRIMMYAASR
jgi:hypothetical protein